MSHLSSPAALWGPVVAVQVLCYALLFFAATRLHARARGGAPFLFLFFSPAFLSLPLLTVGGGFRKEILHFGLCSAACLALLPGVEQRVRQATALAISALMPMLVLSHEVLIVVVPYYLVLGWLLLGPRPSRARYAVWVATIVAGTAVAFGAALTHAGGAAQSVLICRAVVARGLQHSICDGGIRAIGDTAASARADVARMIAADGFAWQSAVALLLVVLPFAAALRTVRRAREPRQRTIPVLLAVGAAGLLTIPVLVVATDWGRFLHLHVVTLTLMLFAICAACPGWELEAERVGDTAAAPRRQRALVVALVLYAAGWHLNHTDTLLGDSVIGLARAEWGPRVPPVGSR